MSKEKALESAIKDAISFKLYPSGKDDIYEYEKELDSIALHWGIGSGELEKALSKAPQVKKFRNKIDSIDRITLSRLPRFIAQVVKDTKVKFKYVKNYNAGQYGGWNGKYIEMIIDTDLDISVNEQVGRLAHEYWHVFEAKSGFQNNLQDLFEKITKEVGLGKGSIEDFKFVIKIIDYYGRQNLKRELDRMEKLWGKEYFKAREKEFYELIDDVKKQLKNKRLYSMITEILADTLKYIVMNKSVHSLSGTLVTWMNKKFSSKDIFIKHGEDIIKSIYSSS